jgi:hypothetical protein
MSRLSEMHAQFSWTIYRILPWPSRLSLSRNAYVPVSSNEYEMVCLSEGTREEYKNYAPEVLDDIYQLHQNTKPQAERYDR